MDLDILTNITYQNTCNYIEEFNINSYNDFTLFNLIKLTFTLISGILLAIIFVSSCFYYPTKLEFEKLYNENKENYEYNPFLITCLDEYYQLQEDRDNDYLKSLNNKYIYYTFNFRDVVYEIVMNYNFDNESFDYYLNTRSYILPFDFLDTISRIYCVKYNCRNIYIDNYNNNEKLINSFNKQDKQDKKDKQDKSNIFYTKNTKTLSVKNEIIYYTSNKYKYKGLLEEFFNSILHSKIYDSSNNLLHSYKNLQYQIFSIKNNNNSQQLFKNNNFISFKSFKNSIIS